MDDILEVIQFLATPFDEDKKDSSMPGEVAKVSTTELLWLELCEKVWTKVSLRLESKLLIEEAESSSTWKLTCTILDILSQLKIKVEQIEENQSEEEKEIEILSVQSQSCILSCIELVIGFGVLPYLLPGVGIPNKYRKRSPAAECILEIDRKLAHVTQFNHLVHVLTTLMDLCCHPTFANLIIAKHLNDILAGVFQTCKSPIAKPRIDSNQMVKETSGGRSGLTVDEYEAVISKRVKLDTQFQTDFLRLLPKIMLVKSLLLIGAVQKPKWMMISCNDFLHTILLEKNGLAIISQAVSETLDGAKNWQVCKVVSNLMLDAIKRKNLSKNSKMLTNLCSQCFDLIIIGKEKKNSEGKDTRRRIGLFCATTMTNINSDVAHKIIWGPIFDPVLKIVSNDSTNPKEIENCADFAVILLSLSVPNDISLPIDQFQNVWGGLFQILVCCEKYIALKTLNLMKTHIIVSVRDKLVDIFSLLLEIVSSNSKDEQNMCRFSLGLVLSLTNGRLKALELSSSSESNDNLAFNSFQYHAKESHEFISEGCAIISKSILAQDRLKEVRAQLFCELLTYNQSNENKLKQSIESEKNSSKLNDNEKRVRNEYEKFAVLMLMDAIASDDDKILENCAQVNADTNENDNFKVLELIFVKLTNEMDSSHQEGGNYEFNQSLSYVLGILGALCETDSNPGSAKETSSLDNSKLWEQLDRFVPYLRKLGEQRAQTNADTIATANNILSCIESRGASSVFSATKREKSISRYEKALQDVNSPLVAIKGHGILELKRLIEDQDSEAMKNEPALLKIFQSELRNDDSYVYLMAINGMAALGHKFHEIVMPTLIELYDFHDGVDRKCSPVILTMTPGERIEFRLKIGEILVKVIQKLGVAIAPMYRTSVTNVCFRLIRDEDESVRASALSNLGELCQVLKLALGNILTEVWYCVENLLQSEQNCQVRRGALHLMVLLLRGVANELEAEDLIVNRDVGVYIRDARRMLTKLRDTETDPVALTHVHLALDEISLIAAKFFMLPVQKPA